MEKQQHIKCDVESCKHQNCESGCCKLSEIEVGCDCGCREAEKEASTICKSFECDCNKLEK